MQNSKFPGSHLVLLRSLKHIEHFTHECIYSLNFYDIVSEHQYSRRGSRGPIPTWGHMWVESVLGPRLAPRGFLRVLRFFYIHKNQYLQIPIRLRGSA